MTAGTITLILAIWGAFLSTVAIVWNLYRDFSRRGRLRVSCYIAHYYDPEYETHSEEYLVWNVTNIGREPVMVTHIGGALEKSHFMIEARIGLPHMLQPGEYLLEKGDISLLENKIIALWAIDSIGKTYKAPQKELNHILEEFEKGGALEKRNDPNKAK